MAQTSFPFDGLDTTEDNYSYFFRELIDTGIVGTGNELQVTANGSALKVSVAPGLAIVRGFVYRNTSPLDLPIDAGAAQARIDVVVLRLDPAANSIVAAVVPGTPGSGNAPSLTQTDTGIYELPIATVNVPANAVLIQAANVAEGRRRTGRRVGYAPTSALRPLNPRRRDITWNEESGKWEQYDGTAWVDLFSWSTLAGKPTRSTLDGRKIDVALTQPAGTPAQGDIWFKPLAAG